MLNDNAHNSQCMSRIIGLLSEESKWTKGTHARRADNSCTSWWDYTTTQFSLYGAIRRCCNISDEFVNVGGLILCFIKLHNSDYDLITFNESINTTYIDIVNILNESSLFLQNRERENKLITVTKTMRKSYNNDENYINALDIESIYYLGYDRGLNQKVEWE